MGARMLQALLIESLGLAVGGSLLAIPAALGATTLLSTYMVGVGVPHAMWPAASLRSP